MLKISLKQQNSYLFQMQAHNAMRALIKVRFVDYITLQVFILVLSRLWPLNNLHDLGLQADDRKEGKSACEDKITGCQS